MTRTVVARILVAVPTLLIVSMLIFVMLDISPGDPARNVAGPEASVEQVAQVRQALKLDDPLPVRYADWVGNAVRGDLGTSFVGNRSVTDTVLEALPPTLSIILISLALTIVGALALGVVSALWPQGVVDKLCTLIASASLAMPPMWLALLLVSFVAVSWAWLPALGYVPFAESPWQWFTHLILPAITISGIAMGEIGRQLRGSLRDEVEKDYVLAARARGLSTRRIILKHAMKNAAIPVVTVLGVRLGQVLGTTVLVEKIFVIPGIGNLAFNSVQGGDMPTVLGVVIVATLVVLLLNLLVDLSYFYFNPRLRTG